METIVGTKVTDVRNVSEFVSKYYKKDSIVRIGVTETELVNIMKDEYAKDGSVTIGPYASITGEQVWADFK